MKISDIYNNKTSLPLSFEVFPPKGDEIDSKIDRLIDELNILKKFNPKLVSVTYGAGGSNRDTSFEIVNRLMADEFNVMPHFTCICTKRSTIRAHFNELQKMNIENVLALRGDEPKDNKICYMDFKYANELVEYLKSFTDFSIGIAGYPEGHISAPDLNTDILNLKKKVDAGGDVIFTQLFFDNSKFYNYLELLKRNNINIPVVAGILPISSYAQLDKMLSLAKVTIPDALLSKIEKFKDNNDDIKKLSIEYATKQCLDLIKNNVDGLHFYTLNKSYSTAKILENINL